MKKLYFLSFLVILFSACATMNGTYSYIPVGPQDLSIQVKDPKTMPVYISRNEVDRPWASLGLIRIKNLPNDITVIAKEIDNIKTQGAKKGAQALILNQYFEENAADAAYPVTLAAYLVRFLDDVSDEDKIKIEEFGKQAAITTARD